MATGLVTETGDENRDRLVGEITPDIELMVGYVKICWKKTKNQICKEEKIECSLK